MGLHPNTLMIRQHIFEILARYDDVAMNLPRQYGASALSYRDCLGHFFEEFYGLA